MEIDGVILSDVGGTDVNVIGETSPQTDQQPRPDKRQCAATSRGGQQQEELPTLTPQTAPQPGPHQGPQLRNPPRKVVRYSAQIH